MKTFSLNKVAVPSDLESITSYACGVAGDDKSDRIWGGIQKLYRTGMSPAISLCLRHEGEVVIDRAIGYARGNVFNAKSVSPKKLMTTDTPVCMYSASKSVMAMLAHWAQEQGMINLLDPVVHYLPEFGRNGKDKITIKQVLSHRSGIATLPKGTPPETIFDYDECVKRVCESEPDLKDHYRSSYHALTGGYVIGAILEKVSGKSVNELLDEAFRKPLGMKYFQFGLEEQYRQSVALNYATGIKPVGPIASWIKNVLGGEFEQAVDISNDVRFQETVSPSANLYTTANEACRFFEMLLNEGEHDGKQIMQPETIRRAVLPTGAMQMDRVMIFPIRFSMGMMLGHGQLSALGPDSEGAYGHLGMVNILCWADPHRKISGALLTTGKALIGGHFKAQYDLMSLINKSYTRK